MPKMPPGNKAKNPGSPLAAYQRDKRSKTYGPTGGAQPRPTRGPGRAAPKKANPGSPTAAAERQKRARAAGSPTAAAERQARARAAGSPTAAAERQKRATTYGPTGGAQPRPTRGPGRPAPKKPNLGSPSDAAARAGSRGRTAANTGRPKVNPGGVANSAEKNLRVKLSKVDYESLGRAMKASGYGAYGRKAAGKKTLPKTK